jgi:hypothetical protein
MLFRAKHGINQLYSLPMRLSSGHMKTHDGTLKYPSKNLEEAVLT